LVIPPIFVALEGFFYVGSGCLLWAKTVLFVILNLKSFHSLFSSHVFSICWFDIRSLVHEFINMIFQYSVSLTRVSYLPVVCDSIHTLVYGFRICSGVFLWYWGLNPVPHACYISTPLLELHPHPSWRLSYVSYLVLFACLLACVLRIDLSMSLSQVGLELSLPALPVLENLFHLCLFDVCLKFLFTVMSLAQYHGRLGLITSVHRTLCFCYLKRL
jgi:hypothetical protein